MTTATTTATENKLPLENLPRPRVKISGHDGNAFAVIGRVAAALRAAGWTQPQISEFSREAMSGDYQNLLAVCAKYAEVR